MNNEIWTEKYFPTNINEIVGNSESKKQILNFLKNYNKSKKKALFIYGPSGTGKTCSVYAAAKELDMELLEINASDTRDKESIQRIVGSSSMQMSLFGKQKVILVDELDGITKDDFGAIPELVRIIQNSKFPIILIANTIDEPRFKPLLKESDIVFFDKVNYNEIFSLLTKICSKEKVNYDEMALKILATRTGGDVRAAVIDLQILSASGEKITKDIVATLSERQQEETIINALVKIFKTTDIKTALSSFENVDADYDVLKLWLDENLPLEYKGIDLVRAYDAFSMADVFNGRIIRRQYWRLLNYVNDFMTAGIALAKEKKNTQVIKYRQTTRLLQIWMSNQKHAYRKKIARKLAFYSHCSIKKAFEDIIFIKAASKNKDYINSMAKILDLDEDEAEWLAK